MQDACIITTGSEVCEEDPKTIAYARGVFGAADGVNSIVYETSASEIRRRARLRTKVSGMSSRSTCVTHPQAEILAKPLQSINP